MIRAGRYPNGRTIADKFEISHRQAGRDIEYLRDSMGAPLVYSARENGYYYDDDTFVLPAQVISDEERRALAYLAQRYAGAGGELAARLAGFFARLAYEGGAAPGGMAGQRRDPPAQVAVFGLNSQALSAYGPLCMAIEQRRKVELVYVNSIRVRSRRTLCPYRLFAKDQADYVVGYCEKAHEVRVFRLDRIVDLAVTPTRFEVVPFYRAEDYGDAVPFRYTNPYVALIRFSAAMDLRALKLPAHPAEDLPAHSYRVSFYRSEDLLSALLAQSQDFVILSPNWLRARLLARLGKIRQNHLG